jgi:hypothetical protein
VKFPGFGLTTPNADSIFSDLHKFLGELVGLLLSIFGATELLLWQLRKLKRMWTEFKDENEAGGPKVAPKVVPTSSTWTPP